MQQDSPGSTPSLFETQSGVHCGASVPFMLNQPLVLGGTRAGSSASRRGSRAERLLQGVSRSLLTLRASGRKISLLRKLLTLCAQDRPKVYLSVLFLFFEIGCYIALQFFCEQQMDISAALNQPLFACNGGRPFPVPRWSSCDGSKSCTLTCPNSGGSDCSLTALMGMGNSAFCCCFSCEPPHFSATCPSASLSPEFDYNELVTCQKRYQSALKSINRARMNCSATVYATSTPNRDGHSKFCYGSSPQVQVQCSYGSANQTSNPYASALTAEIALNFYYMLALGFGEVVFNALYVPIRALLVCCNRLVLHCVTLLQLHVAVTDRRHKFDQ